MQPIVLMSLLILLIPNLVLASDLLGQDKRIDSRVHAPQELAEGEISAFLVDRDCEEGFVTLATEVNQDKPEFRIITDRGEPKILYITDHSSKLTGIENRRKSRMAEDMGTLIKIAGKMGAGLKMNALQGDDIDGYCVEYRSSFKRAKLRINTLDNKNGVKHTYDVIVGPAEHWYLSADLILSNTKQMTYDSETDAVVEKEKPGSFYIGLNRKFGDVFTNYSGLSFYNNFSIKGMFKASKNPGESFGIGLGYTFDIAEVFVAQVWTKDDENLGGEELGTTDATVIGLSFNLTRALEWLKDGE